MSKKVFAKISWHCTSCDLTFCTKIVRMTEVKLGDREGFNLVVDYDAKSCPSCNNGVTWLFEGFQTENELRKPKVDDNKFNVPYFPNNIPPWNPATPLQPFWSEPNRSPFTEPNRSPFTEPNPLRITCLMYGKTQGKASEGGNGSPLHGKDGVS